MENNDINHTFVEILNRKIKEIEEMYILKTEKKKMTVSDPEKIDYYSKKQLNAINTELDRKYKASKAYKKLQEYS
uniref:Uncharacterized protein n=1 Tax=viral metagenome TaxID=1070528 RepID=A0A6C0IZX1_9ZZZZ